jgi:hypothetical protein
MTGMEVALLAGGAGLGMLGGSLMSQQKSPSPPPLPPVPEPPEPVPMPDDGNVRSQALRKRSAAAGSMKRGGRQSTIMSDSLGAGYE